jgi:hypothetical protein
MAESNEGDGGVNQREPLSSSFAPPNTDDMGRGEGEAPTANEHPHPHGFNNAPMPSVFPRYTVHTYHDYSTFIEEGGVITKHKKSGRNFPARLHAILSNEQYSHIISWMVSNPFNIKFNMILFLSLSIHHSQQYYVYSDVILITASFYLSSCSATWSCLEGPQKGPTGSRRPA